MNNMGNDKPPKNWSSRKGCFFCKQPLITMKEKILRSCDSCAKGTLNGFNKMTGGKIKEGFDDVKNIAFGQNQQAKHAGETMMKNALQKKRNKIEKKLKKKGLTKEQIKEGLYLFDQSLK